MNLSNWHTLGLAAQFQPKRSINRRSDTMTNIISIKDTFYFTSTLGAFQMTFMEALYDYDTDHYDGIQVVVNKGEGNPHDTTYFRQLVTLWGDQRPIFKDGEVYLKMEDLDFLLHKHEEEILHALKESWGPYWWEESDVPPHCLILDHRGNQYDAPRYKGLYRKDAMAKV